MVPPLSRDCALLAEAIAAHRRGALSTPAGWQPLLTCMARRLAEPDPVVALQQAAMSLMVHVVWAQQDARSPDAPQALRAALLQTERVLLLTGAFERDISNMLPMTHGFGQCSVSEKPPVKAKGQAKAKGSLRSKAALVAESPALQSASSSTQALKSTSSSVQLGWTKRSAMSARPRKIR